jgi:hypothetical protein
MALTVAGALMVATGGSASAHFSGIIHYCGPFDAKMSVTLEDYGPGHIIVIINGVEVENADYNGKYYRAFDLDHTKANSWRVIVDADVASFDIDKVGSFCGEESVETTAAPEVTEAPVTTEAPTTTAAAPATSDPSSTAASTTAAPTTTSSVGIAGPVPTSTTIAATATTVAVAGPTPTTVASNPLLPATGSRNTIIVQLGIISMCVGILTMMLVRRPVEATVSNR